MPRRETLMSGADLNSPNSEGASTPGSSILSGADLNLLFEGARPGAPFIDSDERGRPQSPVFEGRHRVPRSSILMSGPTSISSSKGRGFSPAISFAHTFGL